VSDCVGRRGSGAMVVDGVGSSASVLRRCSRRHGVPHRRPSAACAVANDRFAGGNV